MDNEFVMKVSEIWVEINLMIQAPAIITRSNWGLEQDKRLKNQI